MILVDINNSTKTSLPGSEVMAKRITSHIPDFLNVIYDRPHHLRTNKLHKNSMLPKKKRTLGEHV